MMNQLEAYNLLHRGSLALARAERAGIRVDVKYLETKMAHMTRQMDYLERKFKESDFYLEWADSQDKEPNMNSAPQLQNFLYNVKGYTPPKLTATKKGSTNKESLTALNIPDLNFILEKKKLKKIRDYLVGFDREQVDGWLHPNFNLHLVTSYRSSSNNPNFQNIPKRDKVAKEITRRALYPRKGNLLLEADFGALEVAIACAYHKDPTMIKYLESGFDMHGDMAKQIFKIDDFDKHRPDHSYLRGATKNGFVFPQFYGDYYLNCAEYMAGDQWGQLPTGRWKKGQGVPLGDGHLADHFLSVGINSFDKFVTHVKEVEEDFWGRRFKVYARWKEKWWHQYQKTGYVDLLTGFRCRGLLGKNDAINYPVQGAAFHCLLWSFIQLDEELQKRGMQSRLIGQIHDSMIVDVYPPEFDLLVQLIKEITTERLPKSWSWINVPLRVDFEANKVDESWADVKELEI